MDSKIEYLFIATYIFIIPLYAWLLARFSNRKRILRSEQYFYRGAMSILDNVQSQSELAGQISMLYRRLTEKETQLCRSFRSPIEMIEELIVKIDTLEDGQFKEIYKIDRPLAYRKRLVDCLTMLKTANPFSLLSSKEANLLQTLLGAVQSDNRDLGEKTISQLAEELEVLESKMRSDAKKTTVSYIATIVSTILTVFFGIISLIPLLASKAT